MNTPAQAYFWLTSCSAMVWGCRQAFLQMTSALTKEMTLTGEWQTDRQLASQGCCRQQHWGAGAELGLVKTQCLLIITINWRFHDNTILVKEDGELKNLVEKLNLFHLFMFHTAVIDWCWVQRPSLQQCESAYSLAQLISLRTPAARGCWVRGAGCGGKEH